MSDCHPNSDETKIQVDFIFIGFITLKLPYSKTYKQSLFSAVKALDLSRVRQKMHRKFDIT